MGMNPLVRKLMINGAGAISGMVEEFEPEKKGEKPSVALTEFNFCEQGAHYVRDLIEKDFNVISFPATGLGEKAAEDLVNQGLFEAFIDLVPAGFGEFLLGGNRDAGPDRLNAGINQCIPYILSPCGFEMISCGPLKRKDENDPLWVSRNLAERKLFIQDGIRVQARTAPEEMQTIARATAEKLNKGKNKKLIKFIIPKKGFSSVSMEGGALYDAASDRAFIEELINHVDPEIEIIEVDAHINTNEFARAVEDVLNQTLKES